MTTEAPPPDPPIMTSRLFRALAFSPHFSPTHPSLSLLALLFSCLSLGCECKDKVNVEMDGLDEDKPLLMDNGLDMGPDSGTDTQLHGKTL